MLLTLLVQSVVLMSHLGRPDGCRIEKYTLRPCVDILKVRARTGRCRCQPVQQQQWQPLPAGAAAAMAAL